MNLSDCITKYFLASMRVLKLNSKEALLEALTIYQYKDAPDICIKPVDRKERYQVAKHKDIRHQLIAKEVLSEDENLVPIQADETVMLPVKFDYPNRVSFAALKTFIACYHAIRYSRGSNAFSFTLKREELAELAGLSLPSLRKALVELQSEQLIEITQTWREGVRVELLDPEYPSGTRLYEIADFNRREMNSIPVLDRYKLLLSPFDPRGHLKSLTADVQDHGLLCPFCGGGEQAENKRRFRIDTVNDRWYCHNCKRGGDSVRLWGRLIYRVGKDWKPMLREIQENTKYANT